MPVMATRQLAALRGMLVLMAGLTAGGWVMSGLKLLRWDWLLLVPGLVAALWVARRAAGSWRELLHESIEPFASWPLALVGGLVLVSAQFHGPVMLDSLTYRLPRLLLWNQDGFIHYYPTADERLNYLPHVWTLCTLPLVQIAGVSAAWFWSFASWLACQMVFFGWAVGVSESAARARQLSFLASTSTFALLQAGEPANDLPAAALVILSLHFIRLFEQERAPQLIVWSALALCLAAGVKSHFATLGLPFGLWFLLAPSRPWQVFRWRWLPLLLPLWLICSPLPSFVLNARAYGHWLGPAKDKSYQGTGPGWNVLLGTPLMAWQLVQPAVNPLAFVLNGQFERSQTLAQAKAIAPRFDLRMAPINMVDNASLGFLTSLLLAAGVVLAGWKQPALLKSWRGWALAAGLFGFVASVSQFLPGAIGRSFCGFIFLAFPLALAGWARFSTRACQWAVAACLVGSLLILVSDPSRPLWPAEWVHRQLERTGHRNLAEKMAPYLEIPTRTRVARELVELIPPEEPVLLGLIAEDRPILPLMWPARHYRVVLLNEQATLADLQATHSNYVLVSGGAREFYPELCQYLAASGQYEPVKAQDYVSKLLRGPETWTLYHRKTPPGG